jgi:hypothetical protein
MDAVHTGSPGDVAATVHHDADPPIAAGGLCGRENLVGQLEQGRRLETPLAHLHPIHASRHRRGHGGRKIDPGHGAVGDQTEDGARRVDQKLASPS